MPEFDLKNKSSAAKMAEQLKAEVARYKGKVAFLAQSVLARETNRDTGRGANSYFITVGSPSSQIMPEGKYPTVSVIPPSVSLSAVPLAETIYVTNNVYYLVYVNNGTRFITASRFVEKSLTIINNYFRTIG